jgi:hypothetical protein
MPKDTKSMRKYIRHPATIPIFYDQIDIAAKRKDRLKDISLGGLCFQSKRQITPGTVLLIHIPLATPVFQERAMVVWCRSIDPHYEIGVRFMAEESSFRVRMVEQVCYIEKYKQDMREIEGRELSAEQAAMEWIRKYARNFPQA